MNTDVFLVFGIFPCFSCGLDVGIQALKPFPVCLLTGAEIVCPALAQLWLWQ